MHLMKHVLIKHIYWQQIEPVLDWTSHMSLPPSPPPSFSAHASCFSRQNPTVSPHRSSFLCLLPLPSPAKPRSPASAFCRQSAPPADSNHGPSLPPQPAPCAASHPQFLPRGMCPASVCRDLVPPAPSLAPPARTSLHTASLHRFLPAARAWPASGAARASRPGLVPLVRTSRRRASRHLLPPRPCCGVVNTFSGSALWHRRDINGVPRCSRKKASEGSRNGSLITNGVE